MSDETYASIEDYTADVERARDAYAADQAVADGYCAACGNRRRDGQHRRCWTCRHDGVSEQPA